MKEKEDFVMLELRNISKDYGKGDSVVHALKNINLKFRSNEFVSILGQSGCGKTTLLNIIGGLDRYTSGDLIIRGKSTKNFKASDWDSYRNNCIGFVFQSYNLIPHQTVLGNVELALTIAGVSRAERRRRAIEALEKVGLKDQLHKRPNQLSGGQAQRVALARALVNDPEIILADEPTGALDSATSLQVMELFKQIASERLVIMVTHNKELADRYSTRIVTLFDGEITGDTFPCPMDEQKEEEGGEVAEKNNSAVADSETEPHSAKKPQKKGKEKRLFKRTHMSFFTATMLSLRNLLTKKGRTFMTAFAGSIGIIGIALVLALSNGFSTYIERLQSSTLSGYPVSITALSLDVEAVAGSMMSGEQITYEKYPDDDILIGYNPNESRTQTVAKVNVLDGKFEEYIDGMKDLRVKGEIPYNSIKRDYAVPMTVITETTRVDNNTGVINKVISKITTPDNTGVFNIDSNKLMASVTGGSETFQQLLDNSEFLRSQYDLIYGDYPSEYDQLAIVVDEYNRITIDTLRKIGISTDEKTTFGFDEIVHKKYKLLYNDDVYKYDEEKDSFSLIGSGEYAGKFNDEDAGITLTITGVLRKNKTAPLNILNMGLGFLPELWDVFLDNCATSKIAQRQTANPDKIYYPSSTAKDIQGLIATASLMTTRTLTEDEARFLARQVVGADKSPNSYYFYPKNFDCKTAINKYIDAWSKTPEGKSNPISYTDAASILSNTMGQLVNIITYVLITFAAISLVVSSLMIGIITYVSVIERTKEIGVLRSLGARKRDVAAVFNAETILIGLVAGLLGIFVTYMLCIPLNALLSSLAGTIIGKRLMIFNPAHALALVLISVALTFISGLVPSQIAAKRDPVVALRSE